MDQNVRGELAPIVPNNLVGTEVRQQGRTFAQASGPRASAVDRLYSLNPKAIWDFLKRQKPSFWFVCIYLFFEYVRPQQIYTGILGPPYALITIILASVFFLFEQRKLRYGIPEFLLTVFSLVVLVSSFTAFDPTTSFGKLTDYFAWVLIYLLIANVVDTEERFLVFTLSFLLYSFKMSQFGTRVWAERGFAFSSWGTTGAPGWFQNSGEFGIQMCIFLPIVAAFTFALGREWPRWLRFMAWGVAGTAVTGIVASSSRGALVGLAAVVLWWAVFKSRKRVRAILFSVVLASAVYAITPAEQKARFQQAGEDETSVSRTTMWKQGLEVMGDYPILGIGYANWRKYHTTHFGGPDLMIHNVFFEAGSELGYAGLLTFLALITCTFVINRRTRKLAERAPQRGRFIYYMSLGLDGALVGFMASGFFISVLYYPFFWINLAMTVALYNAALTSLPPETATPSVQRAPAWRGSMRGTVGPVS